ncbi:MAG: hypothetical protein CW691_01390 [Candidatus Bathyarchaeum sp.]|nr:MAG: hypothetical protein CW691_01390 [Candidatus Bathyarchaeum sp.]
MPYCHKCGSEVKEENAFCPQCGATLRAKETTPPEHYRNEKAEKEEKQEKHEKEEKSEHQEKYEKQQFGVLGPLVGGIILIIVGFMFYLAVSDAINIGSVFPFFLIIIGGIVILGVLIGAVTARKKNPMP